MIPVVRAELVADYGRVRRVLGATDHPLATRALANTISGDAMETIEAFEGIDDELAREARDEAVRLRRVLAELVPDAACMGELDSLDSTD